MAQTAPQHRSCIVYLPAMCQGLELAVADSLAFTIAAWALSIGYVSHEAVRGTSLTLNKKPFMYWKIVETRGKKQI